LCKYMAIQTHSTTHTIWRESEICREKERSILREREGERDKESKMQRVSDDGSRKATKQRRGSMPVHMRVVRGETQDEHACVKIVWPLRGGSLQGKQKTSEVTENEM